VRIILALKYLNIVYLRKNIKCLKNYLYFNIYLFYIIYVIGHYENQFLNKLFFCGYKVLAYTTLKRSYNKK